ncbi:MAG: hypothetical protein KGM49_05955 [Sphingomonadales bacterium]|nr:hypothetical protein [Sphingomonadales bacterium]
MRVANGTTGETGGINVRWIRISNIGLPFVLCCVLILQQDKNGMLIHRFAAINVACWLLLLISGLNVWGLWRHSAGNKTVKRRTWQ